MVKKLFNSALLIQIVTGIVAVIGMVVDGAVTGSCLGTEAMAGYGIATPVATIFIACAGVCQLGASLLIGRLVGARKTEEAAKALSSCLAFAFVLSLVMTAAVFFFSEKIAGFLGATGEITHMAAEYLKGFSLCAPALLLLTLLLPIMQINGRRGVVVLAIVVMTGVNVTGDLLVGLVFKGGLFGMAMATTVSYFAALALFVPFLFRKDSAIRISFRSISFSYIGEMLSGGLPTALQQVCRSLLILVLNKELLRIASSGAVAAFTAIMSAANLSMAVGSGVSASVSMLTGVFAGDRDDVAIRELMRTAVRTAVIYDAGLCAVLIAGARLLMPMFSADEAILQMCVTGFRLYCLSMIGYSVNVTLRMYYQAMHFSGLSYAYVVCNSFLFTAAGAWLLGGALGVNGVWLSFLFGETLSLAALVAYMLLKKGARGGFTERMLSIPASLTADVLDRFDGSASDVAEMIRVSEQAGEFCRKNGAGARTAFVLSLAAEELGVFILQHNGAGGKRETVEVRLILGKNSWTMRLRDNGSRFDPLTVVKEKGQDDNSCIGVKMITDMVSRAEYVDTLNINNLILEINK